MTIKKHFHKTVIAFLILLCATSVLAQNDQTAADRWAGMLIDVSTPDNAIRLFGTPSKERQSQSRRASTGKLAFRQM